MGGMVSVTSCTLFNPLTKEPKESVLHIFKDVTSIRHQFPQSETGKSTCSFKTTNSFAVLHIYSRNELCRRDFLKEVVSQHVEKKSQAVGICVALRG